MDARPLRVLEVSPYAEAAWGYGGIPRVLGALSRALAARGHQVTVVASDARDGRRRLDGGSTAVGPGLRQELFRNASNRAAYRWQLFWPLGLRRRLGQLAGQVDVGHLHACHHFPGAWAAAALGRAGVPYVVSPHGTAPRIERRRLAKAVFDATAGRRMLPGAARLLAVSEAERRGLEQMGIEPGRIAVVPNPVAPWPHVPERRARFRRRFGLGDGPVVLFLGKLSPRKRADVALRAFARLAGGAARMVVAGNDYGEGARLRRLADELGIAARTTFTGLLAGDERGDAIAAAEAVVSPGEHEVFGLVAVEALLLGVPVVVADDSGCAEVVGALGGGRTVPAGDVEALAAAVAGLLARPAGLDGELRRAAAEARRRFDPQRIAGELETIYRSVVEAAPARRTGSGR